MTTAKEEIESIRVMLESLEPLSMDARLRVLAYAISFAFDSGRHPVSEALYAEARKAAHATEPNGDGKEGA